MDRTYTLISTINYDFIYSHAEFNIFLAINKNGIMLVYVNCVLLICEIDILFCTGKAIC